MTCVLIVMPKLEFRGFCRSRIRRFLLLSAGSQVRPLLCNLLGRAGLSRGPDMGRVDDGGKPVLGILHVEVFCGVLRHGGQRPRPSIPRGHVLPAPARESVHGAPSRIKLRCIGRSYVLRVRGCQAVLAY